LMLCFCPDLDKKLDVVFLSRSGQQLDVVFFVALQKIASNRLIKITTHF
jgi:hypothetical protein